MPSTFPFCNILGPQEIIVAASAFEAALAQVNETCSLDPRTIRLGIASAVLDAMFRGERDVDVLCSLAVQRVTAPVVIASADGVVFKRAATPPRHETDTMLEPEQ